MADYEQQALVTYPGIQAWEDWDFTDVAGIAPSTGIMTVFPQFGLPQLEGDIVMTQGNTRVVLKNMRIDSAFYQRNSGGQVVQVKFLDERWKWAKDFVISGRYNVRMGDNVVDPLTEKTPFELVELLFAAMGVTNYDAELLKTIDYSGLRPLADWDVATPAHELQNLMNEFATQLVPQRSTGKFVVCRMGQGANLPDNLPYQDPGEGIDPKETPEALRVYGSPIRYQVRLELEAVGQEIFDTANQPSPIPADPKAPRPTNNADGSWKPIDQLTYIPTADGRRTWGQEDENFEGVGRDDNGQLIRVQQPDGTYVTAQELAMKTVYKCYRVKADSSGKITIPGYRDPITGENTITRRQLVLSNVLAEKFTDPDGQQRQKPAFCDFVGIHKLLPETSVNTKGGTRLDYQAPDNPDDNSTVVTFSVNTEEPTSSLTSSAGIVTFSTPLTRIVDASTDVYPAKVWLTCAVNILHPVTFQPIRYTKTLTLSGAPPTARGEDRKFVRPIRKDDIQQYYLTSYGIADDGSVSYQDTKDNISQCGQEADYYLDAAIAEFDTPNAQTRTYQCIAPIDMDGAINQITYTIGKSGADTKASRGTEHDVRTPSYKEQQQRVLRNEIAQQKAKADALALKKGKK